MSYNQPGPYGQQPQQPQQPPQGYGQQPQWGQQPPQQQPYGQQPQYGGGFQPQPPRHGNPGAAVALAAVVMLILAGIYGFIFFKSDGTQIGYLAIGLGALIGLTLGKVGGRSPALPVVGAVLALLGVYLGQIFGIMMAMNDIGMPWDVVFENFDKVMEAWSDNAEAADYLFIVLGGAAAFGTARQTGN